MQHTDLKTQAGAGRRPDGPPHSVLCFPSFSWRGAVLGFVLTLVAAGAASARDQDLPLDPRLLGENGAGEDLAGPPDGVFEELALLVRVGNVEARAEAIWRLARLDDDRSVGPIAQLVPGCKPGLRPFVAMGVGWLGNRASKAAAGLAGFLGDPSEFTQGTAVWALGRTGGTVPPDRAGALRRSGSELLRFLVEEAAARAQGKELLPPTPLHRPLKGARVLVVGEQDAPAVGHLFRGPLTREAVRFDAVRVGPFNPTMGKLGGMSQAERERFGKLLEFHDGQPQVDVVVLTPLYEHELAMPLRWELWNYVRRGGKLVMSTMPLMKFNLAQLTTSHQQVRASFEWRQSLFDALLPASVGTPDLPFLYGAAAASRALRYGTKAMGRGATVVVDTTGSKPVPIAALYATRHKTTRNMAFWAFLGRDRATDPVLWHRMFRLLLEGPGAFRVLMGELAVPPLNAGSTARIPVPVRNCAEEALEVRAAAAVVDAEGKELSRAVQRLSLPKGATGEAIVALPVPLDASPEGCRLRCELSVGDGAVLHTAERTAKVVPAISIEVEGPGEFHGAGERLRVKARLEKRPGAAIEQVDVTAFIADRSFRPLLRRVSPVRLAGQDAAELEVDFTTADFPAGMYHWLVEARVGRRVAGRATAPLARMAPWRFRRELVVAPFGFGPVPSKEAVDAHRAIGMTTYGLPPAFGLWTYLIESPAFLPRHGWPAEVLEGPEGDEWRKLGQRFRRHPLMTFLDTVEESDLQVGSDLMPYGDVEAAGHEQYRIYLKRKYRTLSALNAAWKSDYTDWSEIDLLGAVPTASGHVVYTSQIGMTSGQLVAVPKALDPARGIRSFQPYHDQNAWRWDYVWFLLEVRHAAYHQADPYHPLEPGGAMGLHAPFDCPHFRTYAWGSISHFGRRVTLGRPTYGTTPHTVLIGVPDNEPALGFLCWQAIASGGRFLMPYAAGDQYGVPILRTDYSPTEMGKAFGRIIRHIKSKQEVLLATRNVVEPRVLLLSEGDNGYASAFSPELYEALAWSGILPDYGAGLSGRRLVVTGARELPERTVQALDRFVRDGGLLLLLPGVSAQLLRTLGTERSARVGKGEAVCLDSLPPTAKEIQDRYARAGTARQEAEALRKLVASVAARAGIQGAFQTADEDGTAIPYVEVELLATEDGSQQYLIAYADHRLPQSGGKARGRIRVKLPGVASVYDVYRERRVPLADGGFPFEFEPGEGSVFSLLTEQTALDLAAETKEFGPGAPLRLRLAVKRADGTLSACEHAFNLHVLDATGKEIEGLHQRVSVRGSRIIELFPSWPDPDGEWRIVAHDLTTGAKAETRVRKRNAAPPPPAEPTDAFQPPAPDVRVTLKPLPELSGQANFVTLELALESPSKRPAALRVALRAPDHCLLEGEREQTVRLTAEAPAARIAWTLFIRREDAVGFYYSDKPSGFLTDRWRPEVRRYRGAGPVPALELRALGGEAITWQTGDGTIGLPAPSLIVPVPVALNPFERAPFRIGTLTAQPVEVSILNGTAARIAGAVGIQPLDRWAGGAARLDFAAESAAVARVALAASLRDGAAIDPGVYDVPLTVHLGERKLDAGKVRVEHLVQRKWFVRRGSRLDTEKEEPPFGTAGPFAERDGWKPLVTGSRVEVGGLLARVGEVAYAATCIVSPQSRPAQLELPAVGARVRAWLNGIRIEPTGQGADRRKPTEADDELDLRLPPEFHKGRNILVIEFLKSQERCRGTLVTFRDKEGKALRDLTYGE